MLIFRYSYKLQTAHIAHINSWSLTLGRELAEDMQRQTLFYLLT